MNKTAPTLDEAVAARDKALRDFADLCSMARIVPLPLNRFVDNRIEYIRASEAVWDGLFRNIADTGVKVIR